MLGVVKMALQKEIITPYGVTASYWRIIELSINYAYKIAKIRLAGYINKEARDNGVTPIEVKLFNCNPKEFDMFFDLDKLNELNNNPLRQAYDFIKNNSLYDNSFSDSIDV